MMPRAAIPTCVVDDHNEALNSYYQLIARKKIPFADLCLIHFDSHPDLAPPESIPVDQFSDRHGLLDNLTISDWILPAVYSRHFATVVWVKPTWATQIYIGEHEIVLGVDEEGLLKTSSTLPYYTSDLCYRDKLRDIRSFKLHVIEMPLDSLENDSSIHDALSEIIQDRAWCLDIDMDFYSTQNPFKELLDKHFNLIDSLFKFHQMNSLTETLAHRKSQLDCLEKLCKGTQCDEDNDNKATSEYLASIIEKHPNLYNDISEVREIVKKDEYITDLFYIGQQTELPHHITTVEDIKILLNKTERLLGHLNSKPVAITMARSEYDEYSTAETLDYVHSELVYMLKRLYNVRHDLKCPNVEL